MSASSPCPLVLVAAVARNGAIGRGNALPWRLPGDLRHFRALTMGKPLIMGRRTWQSVGRPLPGRHVIVVSADPLFAVPPGARLCRDLGAAVAEGRILAARHGAGAVMVAGGAMVYAALMAEAARLEVTEVDLQPGADAFFPTIDPRLWREASRRPRARAADDEAAYAFVTYERLPATP